MPSMKVLVADKFEQSGLDALKAAGCDVIFEPGRIRRHARRGHQENAGAGAGRAIDAGHRSDAGCGRVVADRPRRRRRQYHRRGGGVEARHLRVELPRQELRRGRRADDGIDPRARSAHPRQRRRAARGHVEQEGILEGEGADGADARPARLRPHRPRGRQARACVRHAGRGVEPPLQRRRGGARRGPGRVRHRGRRLRPPS